MAESTYDVCDCYSDIPYVIPRAPAPTTSITPFTVYPADQIISHHSVQRIDSLRINGMIDAHPLQVTQCRW